MVEKSLSTRIGTEEKGKQTIETAIEEISRMSTELGIPEPVRQVACAIYNRSLNEKIVENRTIAELSAGSLYAACKTSNHPIRLVEILNASTISKRSLGRTYAELSRQLELKVGPTDPKQFVPRFCESLRLDEEAQAKAKDILEQCEEDNLHVGRSPSAFAAAAVYVASLLINQKRTQREVAEATDISETTIRNTYQAQIKSMGLV